MSIVKIAAGIELLVDNYGLEDMRVGYMGIDPAALCQLLGEHLGAGWVIDAGAREVIVKRVEGEGNKG